MIVQHLSLSLSYLNKGRMNDLTEYSNTMHISALNIIIQRADADVSTRTVRRGLRRYRRNLRLDQTSKTFK